MAIKTHTTTITVFNEKNNNDSILIAYNVSIYVWISYQPWIYSDNEKQSNEEKVNNLCLIIFYCPWEGQRPLKVSNKFGNKFAFNSSDKGVKNIILDRTRKTNILIAWNGKTMGVHVGSKNCMYTYIIIINHADEFNELNYDWLLYIIVSRSAFWHSQK